VIVHWLKDVRPMLDLKQHIQGTSQMCRSNNYSLFRKITASYKTDIHGHGWEVLAVSARLVGKFLGKAIGSTIPAASVRPIGKFVRSLRIPRNQDSWHSRSSACCIHKYLWTDLESTWLGWDARTIPFRQFRIMNPFLFIRGLSCPRSVKTSLNQKCLK
jgi:hypothetical protein